MNDEGPSPRVRGSLAWWCWCPPRAGVHPRVCGEASVPASGSRYSMGPSPRVRGSHFGTRRVAEYDGSIPACAGKPPVGAPSPRPATVHPRVCGEALRPSSTTPTGLGPSPRVRGSPEAARRHRALPGSIPACAGKPAREVSSGPFAWVHPRVCGEAHSAEERRRSVKGSIPACAGKPSSSVRVDAMSRVHPRVCGEAVGYSALGVCVSGPSPRVRGSRSHTPVGICWPGSIPACAGKPASGSGALATRAVHPRVCGEAWLFAPAIASITGPSPRVRGSPEPRHAEPLQSRSIPACAGKPTHKDGRLINTRVHPRVCGEAVATVQIAVQPDGPSPRVRGSRCVFRGDGAYLGSIPACAGKPSMNPPML